MGSTIPPRLGDQGQRHNMNTLYQIAGSIDRSISRTEIVTVIKRAPSMDDLFAEFFGEIPVDNDYEYVDTYDADGRPMREVWSVCGSDDTGDAWRVHLVLDRVPDAEAASA